MPPAARSTLRSMDRLGQMYLQKELAIVSVEYRQLLFFFVLFFFAILKIQTMKVPST